MMRIRAEWCGSVRTGVESVLVRAESAEPAQSVRIRVEHQGEGKLLQSAHNTGLKRQSRHFQVAAASLQRWQLNESGASLDSSTSKYMDFFGSHSSM